MKCIRANIDCFRKILGKCIEESFLKHGSIETREEAILNQNK